MLSYVLRPREPGAGAELALSLREHSQHSCPISLALESCIDPANPLPRPASVQALPLPLVLFLVQVRGKSILFCGV